MPRTSLAVALLLLAATGVSHAQQEIEWKQTINVPKGQNMPRERADILGIELGDTYPDAKAKLAKLATESVTQDSGGMPFKEDLTSFRVQAPGATAVVKASFVSKLIMERQLPGKGGRPIEERIQVYLSAPSSGHQVLAIERSIHYYTEVDQPLVSELLAQMNKKQKSEPREDSISDQSQYTYQFKDGQPYTSRNKLETCSHGHTVEQAQAVQFINSHGNCDAMMHLKIGFGISRGHAKYIYFTLVDNERAKANLGADFAFVRDYVQTYQEQTRGALPKL